MIKKFLGLMLVATVLFSACEKETRPLTEIQDETIQAYLKANNLTGFIKDSTGFYYKILNPGTGDALVGCPGSDYVGIAQTTTSINKSVNYEFSKYNPQYNSLCYIKPISWRESVSKLKKGGEVRVITPSYLAFGKDGSGSSIPGNAILDTKILLVNDTDRPAYEDALIQTYLTEKGFTATKDPNGIYYKIITPGTGAAITPTSTVKAAYTGNLLTGFIIEKASLESPASINLGTYLEGWKLVLPLIKTGGKIKLYIPSRLAYGKNPPPGIPVDAILEFEIELTEAK